MKGFFEVSVEDFSPTDFELFVRDHMESIGADLEAFKIEHNVKLTGEEGYRIDVNARFRALGGDYLVLIECKHQKHRVKRDVVLILKQKIESLGAQKGMLFSTSGFQSGAIDFARKHGIALVKICEGKATYQTRALETHSEPPPWANIPTYVGYMYIESRICIVSINRLEYLKEFIFSDDKV